MKEVVKLFKVITAQFLYPVCPLCHDKANETAFCQHCQEQLSTLKTPEVCCLRCSRILASAGICGSCQQTNPIINRLWVGYDYTLPLDSLILRWKNQQQLSLSTALSQLFMAHPPPWLASIKFDGVVAVPLSDKRLLQRGFNQSMELAKNVAQHYDIPLIDSQYIRRKHRPPQSSLSRKERLSNLKNSFMLNLPYIPATILIIDDVVTTTTTLNELAKSLKRIGVRAIYAWALSRRQQ